MALCEGRLLLLPHPDPAGRVVDEAWYTAALPEDQARHESSCPLCSIVLDNVYMILDDPFLTFGALSSIVLICHDVLLLITSNDHDIDLLSYNFTDRVTDRARSREAKDAKIV